MTPEDARHHARAWALARKSVLFRENEPEVGSDVAMYSLVGAEAGYEALAKELEAERELSLTPRDKQGLAMFGANEQA